jgi:dTDP-glucose 4,6-dehydratase
MKLLITGGAGFIGSHFVHYWIKHHSDDTIVVLDKLTYAGNLANLESVMDTITFVRGDVANEADVTRAIDGVDTIVHFAAESHVDRSINDPFVFTRTNVLGTHVLLEAARKNNIKRFHHISTDEVFGDIALDEHYKFNETTPYNPRSPYAASKASSDHLVRAYSATYNLPFTMSNCSNNFGTFHHPEKFIPRSIVRLLQHKNIPIYTPGNQIRDWLYVDDHCRAIELILEKGKLGETYCIGGMTEEISNLDVAKKILSIMQLPDERIELVTDRPGHDVKYAVDWTKINKDLGWHPQRSFDEWLETTVAWYKHNEAWWKPLAEESEQFYLSKDEQIITQK